MGIIVKGKDLESVEAKIPTIKGRDLNMIVVAQDMTPCIVDGITKIGEDMIVMVIIVEGLQGIGVIMEEDPTIVGHTVVVPITQLPMVEGMVATADKPMAATLMVSVIVGTVEARMVVVRMARTVDNEGVTVVARLVGALTVEVRRNVVVQVDTNKIIHETDLDKVVVGSIIKTMVPEAGVPSQAAMVELGVDMFLGVVDGVRVTALNKAIIAISPVRAIFEDMAIDSGIFASIRIILTLVFDGFCGHLPAL